MQIRDVTSAEITAVVALWEKAGQTRPWNPPASDLQRAVKVQLMVRAGNAAVLGFYDHLGYEDSDVQVRSKWLGRGSSGRT